MTHHPRTGFGPEITEDELKAAGRVEFARFVVGMLKSSRKASDPVTVVRALQGRPGIDQETHRLVLTMLFRPRALPKMLASMGVAANHA